ncbi:MAG: helix-turn-helix transcriptional regulator [Thermonemataceae bacterium]|nr:helix-turn-helix transcriptional regulator [Thermonemataceae bacterium]
MELRKTLANNLKQIREKNSFSQKGMAEKLGISLRLYNELENANANPYY